MMGSAYLNIWLTRALFGAGQIDGIKAGNRDA
jgi:hypothetical protein